MKRFDAGIHLHIFQEAAGLHQTGAQQSGRHFDKPLLTSNKGCKSPFALYSLTNC
jgi:hypothetical protein